MSPIFDVVDLDKSCNGQPKTFTVIPVYYARCVDCGFVFTSYFDGYDGHQWRERIYNDEYYRVIDPDYTEKRPQWNAVQVVTIAQGAARNVVGLDYGGGNGRTAEILRERGQAYDSYDPYGCIHLTPGRERTYNFCSAFEVAEHSVDPVGMMADIIRLVSPGPLIVLIGTLAHDGEIDDPIRLNWWYAAPRNGHVSLYSRRSLTVLGERFGLSLISFNASQHVFFRGHDAATLRRRVLLDKVRRRVSGLLTRRP